MFSRRILSAIALVALSSSTPAGAREAARSAPAKVTLPDGPEFAGSFDGVVGGKRVPLERQKSNYKMKMKAMGFGGATGFMEIQGEHSPIRFNRQQDFYFLTRIQNESVDPTQYISLMKAKVKKGNRRFENVKVGGMGLSGGQMVSTDVLYSVERYKKNFLKIRISDAGETGEYALTVTGGAQVFAFGID